MKKKEKNVKTNDTNKREKIDLEGLSSEEDLFANIYVMSRTNERRSFVCACHK